MDVRTATYVCARAGLVVPARGRVQPGTRAHRDCGRAGRKRSVGAGEVEDRPPSGTEREGGADGGRWSAVTAPANFPPGPAFFHLHPGGARTFWGWEGRGKGRTLVMGWGLDTWRRPGPGSRRDELRRGGVRAQKSGEGPGAPGRKQQ